MIDHVELDFRATLLGVRDQGPRPTCLAHAVTAAHEHARGSGVYLSPEYLHFFADTSSLSSARSVDQMAKALHSDGQAQEVDCPYLPADPLPGWKPPYGVPVLKYASEPKMPDASSVELMIRAGRAPILGITLPESFFDLYAPWLIPSGGRIRGLHAVTCAGLGRHQGDRIFLIRNSWGVDWGDGGYAWLDDDFLLRHLKQVMLLMHEILP